MNSWRQDKNKVMKFINNNPYLINNNIIKIIPKTRKNTWKEIKEDLKRQYLIEYNRRKSIRDQRKTKKSEPIDFIQSNIFAEPKEIYEPFYPNVEEDLFNQATDLEAQHQQEILNNEIQKIKNANIAKDGLRITFKEGKEVNFNNLKKAIRDKLNSINLDGLYIQVGFLTYDNIVRYQTFSINSEKGIKIIDRILRGEDFENDFGDDEDFEIEVSGMNKDFSQATVSTNQIIEITLINQKNIGREIKNKIYADNGGSFYIYKINEKFKENHELVKKLERYQIFEDLNNPAFNENCLVYAMRQTNLFSEAILNNMRTTCFSRYISKKQLQKFGDMYNIKFNVVKYRPETNKFEDITHGKKGTKGSSLRGFFGSDKDDALKIRLALINGHYILNEDVKGVSTFYLKNYDAIESTCQDMTQEEKFKITKKSNGKYRKDKSMYHEIKSYYFVKFMTSDNKTWSFDDLCHLRNNLYEFNTNEIKDLNNFTDKDFKAFEHQEPKETEISKIYFADTETDTSGPHHVAFCIAYSEQDEVDENFNIIDEHQEIKFEFGRNCLTKFLDNIENNSLVYFHNLGYDIRQFNEYIINKECCKNTKVMNAEIIYNDKKIYFKDTLSIVSMKLADFPKSFGLDCGEKEMFPYKYYTFENFEKLNNMGIISEAGKQELKHSWNQKIFEENLNKLGIAADGKFNMVEYVKFYCKQDVRILKQGFQKFRKMCWESLKIDVNKTLTAPSLANQYFTREIYEKIPDYYLYGGIVRAFIQKAVYGGRCMTRLNKRWSVNEELADFDAVSLYPSAMKRLYCVKGKPEVLKPEELNTTYLLNNTCVEDEQPNKNKPISTYVVEILITNINKHLAFPCVVYKDKETNTNKNDDGENAIGKTAVVDNITLEDWIKYNGLECEVLRGYKWTGEKSFLIRDVIQNLHLLRCEYKKTKNPLQLVIKLIMNSAYGKMIQKPITTTTEFKRKHTKIFRPKRSCSSNKKLNDYVDDYPLDKYLIKNSAKIISYIQVNENLYAIKVGQQIDTFYTNTLLGVQILSMSKRIMNEVMCTAEDIGIKIYYQDTDSMHIQKNKIDDLAKEYKKRFGRELIGKNLGQFHNDFDEVENGYAYKSIFVGKKMYVDMLKNEKNKQGIHYRMKGVNLDCVKLYSEENNCEIFDIYNKLYNNEEITFDLLKAKPCFKMNDNQTVTNLLNFDRTIKATAK